MDKEEFAWSLKRVCLSGREVLALAVDCSEEDFNRLSIELCACYENVEAWVYPCSGTVTSNPSIKWEWNTNAFIDYGLPYGCGTCDSLEEAKSEAIKYLKMKGIFKPKSLPVPSFPAPDFFDLTFRYNDGNFHICDIGEIPRIVEEGKDADGRTWDFDVYLPSRNFNLQRELCWTGFQKEQLIWSLLRRRPIPPIVVCDQGDCLSRVRQVIDGKQRIHAIYEFLVGRWPIYHDGDPFYRQDLPGEYKFRLEHQPLFGCCARNLTEDQLVEWFLQINFAGTPQDEAHRQKLLKEA